MNKKPETEDNYRSFLLLEEISKGSALTQRDLSKTLGVALGLINSYVKNLISKGYITVSKIPKKRYQYYLTPSGFAEKTRLTFQHFQNFTNLYKVARRDFHDFFNEIQNSEVKEVVFCGVDEVTEIAFLSLKETNLKLTGVIDDHEAGKSFFGQEIRAIKEIGNIHYDIVVITLFQNGEKIKNQLLDQGVDEKKIFDIGSGDWLKKLSSQALI
jgi:DNA-binding MarR family transcriptional regulator